MGVFEIDKFSKGSLKMSHYISESHATTVIGGGDTADVVARADDADEMFRAYRGQRTARRKTIASKGQ